MNKIYQSIRDLELHTNVILDKKVIPISFIGGSMSPQRINGKFGTTDKNLQKALESDSGFNKTFKLFEEITDESDDDESNDDFTPIEEIETNQQAQEYLLSNFPEDFIKSNLKTNAQAEEAANSKGLTFPNL